MQRIFCLTQPLNTLILGREPVRLTIFVAPRPSLPPPSLDVSSTFIFILDFLQSTHVLSMEDSFGMGPF